MIQIWSRLGQHLAEKTQISPKIQFQFLFTFTYSSLGMRTCQNCGICYVVIFQKSSTYLGTIYNCNAPLFFSFEKWTFGLHCISSRCSMLLLLLLVAHCCTLLPLLQFWKKNRIGSVKKVSFPLFFFLFSPSLSLWSNRLQLLFIFFGVCGRKAAQHLGAKAPKVSLYWSIQ